MIDHYVWRGGREAMLRFGPEDGPLVIVALPLFEEANRIRAFCVALCRTLARLGVASALPDVPGQGESLIALEDCTLGDMRAGFSAAAAALSGPDRKPVRSIVIRSGALLDTDAAPAGRWMFAPQPGKDLVQALDRVRRSADLLRSADSEQATPVDPSFVEIAGNRMSKAFLKELRSADIDGTTQIAQRIVRLNGDPRPADRIIEEFPLWRRTEPTNDLALATLLAADIAAWIARCDE